MKGHTALQRSRHKAQRGSVLGAVLIITAFLAILAGALMTELSTNLLISRVQVNRIATEATVNSAIELTMNTLQTTPLQNGCAVQAALPPTNNQTAAVAYSGCTPVSSKGFNPSAFKSSAASSNPFRADGTHVMLPSAPPVDEYLVGDAGATIYRYPFGQLTSGQLTSKTPMSVGGTLTGPPTALMPDPNKNWISNLVPVNEPGAGCAMFCVALLAEDLNSLSTPSITCFMAAGAPVTASPAGGWNNPDVAFFGDANGSLFADSAGAGGSCAQLAPPIPMPGAVVAGPVVFPGPIGSVPAEDEVYAVLSTGVSSQLVWYSYKEKTNGKATFVIRSVVPLPWGSAIGIAIERPNLPARLAVTFAGGHLATIQVQLSLPNMLLSSATIPAAISGAPYWCQCPQSGGQIGVGAQNGRLYTFKTDLSPPASFAGSAPISTTPSADSLGDWFFATSDGLLYEVPALPFGIQQPISLSGLIGAANSIGSSPVAGDCVPSICVYMGSLDHRTYLMRLDARNAVISASACTVASPPACTPTNPRLWTQVVVEAATGPGTVQVSGWSYYSP